MSVNILSSAFLSSQAERLLGLVVKISHITGMFVDAPGHLISGIEGGGKEHYPDLVPVARFFPHLSKFPALFISDQFGNLSSLPYGNCVLILLAEKHGRFYSAQLASSLKIFLSKLLCLLLKAKYEQISGHDSSPSS